MMKLVSLKDVTPDDLPFIESPFHAASHIKRVFFSQFDSSIQGIDLALNLDFTFERPKRNDVSLARLLRKIESAEVVLIHQNDKPFSPAFRPKTDLKTVSKTEPKLVQSNATEKYETNFTGDNVVIASTLSKLASGFFWTKASMPKAQGGAEASSKQEHKQVQEQEQEQENDGANEVATNESEDPKQTNAADSPSKEKIKQYEIVVIVQTRSGDIPLEGLPVLIDGKEIGKTDKDGKSPKSAASSNESASIEVTYKNAQTHLRAESFTLQLSNINPDTNSYELGNGKNFISKVQDVLGSGAESLGGDLDFTDEYPYEASFVSMETTDNPNLLQLQVNVKMATFSLNVPYLSQVGDGESITIQTSPSKNTQRFKGSKICMPTSTKMLLDYWDIKKSSGSDLSRNGLMQRCWDDHSKPSATYPNPWQKWAHLRKTTGDLVDEHSSGTYSVVKGPAGSSGKIPSGYADSICSTLIKGYPIVTSTFATDGHVMAIRGAVVDNSGSVQWLILNDPYGNLAADSSLYGQLDVSAPVGLKGNSKADLINVDDDVRGVRDALVSLGYYSGSMTDPIDEANPSDPTILAIKALQGGAKPDGRIDPGGSAETKINSKLTHGTKDSYAKKEKEANARSGDNSDRGKHVYYSSLTEAKGVGKNHRFILKGQSWTLVIKKNTPFTTNEIKSKLTPHA